MKITFEISDPETRDLEKIIDLMKLQDNKILTVQSGKDIYEFKKIIPLETKQES